MLHGNICINKRYIAVWEAVCLDEDRGWPVSPNRVSTYRVTLEIDQKPFRVETELDHRYGDGAVSLASKVLWALDKEMRRE